MRGRLVDMCIVFECTCAEMLVVSEGRWWQVGCTRISRQCGMVRWHAVVWWRGGVVAWWRGGAVARSYGVVA